LLIIEASLASAEVSAGAVAKADQHQEKQSNLAQAGTELGTAQPQLVLDFLLVALEVSTQPHANDWFSH
jgi:hypothetical protein